MLNVTFFDLMSSIAASSQRALLLLFLDIDYRLQYVYIVPECRAGFCMVWMYLCVFKVASKGLAPKPALMCGSGNLLQLTYIPSHLFLSPSLSLFFEGSEVKLCM